MKNYIALDGGGTKMLAIMYDEQFRPIKSCRVGSLRETTNDKTIMEENLKKLIEGLDLRGKTIDHICGLYGEWEFGEMSKICEIRSAHQCLTGEMDAGLGAAEIFGEGVLALAGTGATSFTNYGGAFLWAGGAGPAISDTGSGYWIGRCAMEAVIRDYEQWGEPTLLTDLILESKGITRENSKEDYDQMIMDMYGQKNKSCTTVVAELTPLVTKAADLGDKKALEILRNAGQILGERTASLYKRYQLPRTLPITISGSVWRGHPILFQTFEKVLNQQGLRQVILPKFEPIVGVIMQHYYRVHGNFPKEVQEKFIEWYPEFRYEIRQ